MKYLLYILPLALVVCSACGESHKSNERDDNNNERKRIGWNYSHLYGDVKEAKVYYYHDVKEYCGEYYPEGDYTYYVYKFNSNGNVSTSKRYDKYGDIDSQSEYFYDSNNRLIRETYTSDFYNYNEVKYTYDSNGNCVKEEHYEEGVLEGRVLYTYDDNGNCTEIIKYNGSGRLDYRHVKTFDNQNRYIESYSYNRYNKFEHAYIREYDDNNNIIYEYYVEPDGQMYLSHIYKKNVDGKEIERGSYNSDGELTNVYTYEYDSNGNLSSSTKTSFVGDNYAEYIVYKYDDLNNIVSECRKNIYGSYEHTVFLEFEIIF